MRGSGQAGGRADARGGGQPVRDDVRRTGRHPEERGGVRGDGAARPGRVYRLDLAALGVASRLPLQSLPTLTLLDAVSPAVVAASEMSLGST